MRPCSLMAGGSGDRIKKAGRGFINLRKVALFKIGTFADREGGCSHSHGECEKGAGEEGNFVEQREHHDEEWWMRDGESNNYDGKRLERKW